MDNTNERISTAPLPTKAELKRRRNPFLQFFRFLRINWTMWKLAQASHH